MLSSLSAWNVMFLLLVGGVLIFVVALVVSRARRARQTGDPAPIVSLTLTIAVVYAALSLIGAVFGFLSALLSPAVTMTVPVSRYWPLPLPDVTVVAGPTADVVGGGFSRADLSIEGLSLGARLLWASGQSLGTLVAAAVAALIAVACFQLLRGAAFAPVVARAAGLTAVVVLVGGLGSQIMMDAAGSMASAEALLVTAAEWTGYPDEFDLQTALPQPTLDISIDFWPIGAALGLGALAAVFRYGSVLQRETEGLV